MSTTPGVGATQHAGRVVADGAGPRPVTPVGIIAETLERVRERLHELDVRDLGLVADVDRAWRLAGGLDDYASRCTTPESDALRALSARTDAEDWTQAWSAREAGVRGLEREMLSGHVEGQTLKFLVHATKARRVLEIGMFTGYSALAMAEALPDDGVLVACELDADVARLAQECFDASPAGTRIDVRVGPAAETLTTLAEAGALFDLVFIDADKAGYTAYVAALLDGGLLAPCALICVDNTMMQGDPWLPGESSANGLAIADFNKVVARDPRVEQVMLPVRDGLTLIRRVAP